MKDNLLKEKSFRFAVRIVNLYKYLYEDKKEFIISKQILRCGTSVGAMIREAEHSESKVHKTAVAQKEINETIYWIELLFETEYILHKEFESINDDAIEIINIITSLIKTTKDNQLTINN